MVPRRVNTGAMRYSHDSCKCRRCRSGPDGMSLFRDRSRRRFEGGPERDHRRNCVKTRMDGVRLLSKGLALRDFDRQVAQVGIFRGRSRTNGVCPLIP